MYNLKIKVMHSLQNNQIKDFIFGGKAIFTVLNKETKNRVTYKVQLPEFEKEANNPNPIYFVKVLNGTNNDTNYMYIGKLLANGTFSLTKGSKAGKDAPSVKGMEFISNRYLRSNNPHSSFEFYHEGHCARCGRTLTVPESIESGFGPECIKLIHTK